MLTKTIKSLSYLCEVLGSSLDFIYGYAKHNQYPCKYQQNMFSLLLEELTIPYEM